MFFERGERRRWLGFFSWLAHGAGGRERGWKIREPNVWREIPSTVQIEINLNFKPLSLFCLLPTIQLRAPVKQGPLVLCATKWLHDQIKFSNPRDCLHSQIFSRPNLNSSNYIYYSDFQGILRTIWWFYIITQKIRPLLIVNSHATWNPQIIRMQCHVHNYFFPLVLEESRVNPLWPSVVGKSRIRNR